MASPAAFIGSVTATEFKFWNCARKVDYDHFLRVVSCEQAAK
jgi:hypothetical protein